MRFQPSNFYGGLVVCEFRGRFSQQPTLCSLYLCLEIQVYTQILIYIRDDRNNRERDKNELEKRCISSYSTSRSRLSSSVVGSPDTLFECSTMAGKIRGRWWWTAMGFNNETEGATEQLSFWGKKFHYDAYIRNKTGCTVFR